MMPPGRDIASVFREVADLLVNTPELDAALGLTLASVRQLFPDSILALYRYYPVSDELEVVALTPDEGARSLLGMRLSLPVGARVAVTRWRPAEVVRTGKAIHLPAVPLYEDSGPLVDLLCAPINGMGRRLGVLQAISQRPYRFEEEDLANLHAIASLVALAEENARRGRDLQAATTSQLRAEHIAAMSDMTAHITHRIVNDMGAVRLTVQVLKRQLESQRLTDADLLDKLDGIERHSDDAIALVRRVKRPFDRIDTVPMQVESVLGEVLQEFPIPDDVTLDCLIEPDLPPAYATRQIAEVFHHLIRNALEAMADVPEKRLAITARRRDDDRVEVAVQDAGPGVPAHLRGELFRLGVTDKREGLGYGLWWSKLYLTRVGGALDLDSAVPAGACFVVCLQVAPPRKV